VHSEFVAATELSRLDLAQWRDLAAEAAEPNPFFEPEYVLPLARGLGQETDFQLLVVRDSGAWHACLPVHRPRRWHRLPLNPLATWRGHPLYGLLGTPLVRSDRPGEALATLLDSLCVASGTSFAVLEWVAAEGALAEPLAELLESRRPAPVQFERFERAAVRRRPQPNYLEETLSSKHRRELRRQRRKLGEALDEEPEIVDRSDSNSACEAFVALEAASAKGGWATVLAADAGHASFFTEMCRGFAELGRLQLLELQGAGRTIAAKCNLLAADTIFCLKITYDEEWSSLSPGILLELDMLKLFHEESEATSMDSCADPNNAMINRLWPDRRVLTTQTLPTRGASGRAARLALVAARSLRDRNREERE
jgi:CelD/BcsL family acetyltransferase involved in cellulose biosynthesis